MAVDDLDWRERCLLAEALLVKARAGLPWSVQRRAVVDLLGDLRAGQWLDTRRVTAATGVQASVLRDMQALGLVVSRPAEGRFCNKLEWRLEHLVTGPAAEE